MLNIIKLFFGLDFVVLLPWQTYQMINGWFVIVDDEPPDDGIPAAAPIRAPFFYSQIDITWYYA